MASSILFPSYFFSHLCEPREWLGITRMTTMIIPKHFQFLSAKNRCVTHHTHAKSAAVTLVKKETEVYLGLTKAIKMTGLNSLLE